MADVIERLSPDDLLELCQEATLAHFDETKVPQIIRYAQKIPMIDQTLLVRGPVVNRNTLVDRIGFFLNRAEIPLLFGTETKFLSLISMSDERALLETNSLYAIQPSNPEFESKLEGIPAFTYALRNPLVDSYASAYWDKILNRSDLE